MYGNYLQSLPPDRPGRELLLPRLRSAATGVFGRRSSRTDCSRSAGTRPCGMPAVVEWKPALRAALILAVPAGLLSSGLSPLSFFGLLWMAAAAAWAVMLYVRQPAARLDHHWSRRAHWPGDRPAGRLAGLWQSAAVRSLLQRFRAPPGAARSTRTGRAASRSASKSPSNGQPGWRRRMQPRCRPLGPRFKHHAARRKAMPALRLSVLPSMLCSCSSLPLPAAPWERG